MLNPTSWCPAANWRVCFFKATSTLSQQPWATSSRRAWGRWSRSSATCCCPAWFVSSTWLIAYSRVVQSVSASGQSQRCYYLYLNPRCFGEKIPKRAQHQAFKDPLKDETDCFPIQADQKGKLHYSYVWFLCISALICVVWCFSSQEFAQYHLNKSSKYDPDTRKELLKGSDLPANSHPVFLFWNSPSSPTAHWLRASDGSEDQPDSQGTFVCFCAELTLLFLAVGLNEISFRGALSH